MELELEKNKQSDKIENRVALVTGSTSGIGLAIAKKLADDGFTIAFHSRSSIKKGKELADSFANSSYHQADLSNSQETKQLIYDVVHHHKRLDVLINNAGISRTIAHKNLKEASPDIWRELYEVNVIAPWTLISEAEDALRNSSKDNGTSCIINISSHAGIRPKGASIPYATTKAALNHMTKLLALSLAPDIRVNAVAPGLVHTPMTASWEEANHLWRERSPMKRGANPEEIAHIVSMLVSNTYITGEIVMVDGGLNLT